MSIRRRARRRGCVLRRQHKCTASMPRCPVRHAGAALRLGGCWGHAAPWEAHNGAFNFAMKALSLDCLALREQWNTDYEWGKCGCARSRTQGQGAAFEAGLMVRAIHQVTVPNAGMRCICAPSSTCALQSDAGLHVYHALCLTIWTRSLVAARRRLSLLVCRDARCTNETGWGASDTWLLWLPGGLRADHSTCVASWHSYNSFHSCIRPWAC